MFSPARVPKFGELRPGELLKSEKTAKNAKERSIKNSYFHCLILFFLGVLGGSKIDFAILPAQVAPFLPR